MKAIMWESLLVDKTGPWYVIKIVGLKHKYKNKIKRMVDWTSLDIEKTVEMRRKWFGDL